MSAPVDPSTDPDARGLIEAVGLVPCGPVAWGEPVPSKKSGVYVIDLPSRRPAAPIDAHLVQAWLDHVPGLLLGDCRPSTEELAERLQRFWHPSETVLYAGQTTRPLCERLDDFHEHILGNDSPHRGGHWLQTLRSDAGLRVWWAETDEPGRDEGRLLAEFRTRLLRHRPDLAGRGPAELLPFANLQTEVGKRKPHGLKGSVRQ
jgi:hypothetical protein